MTMSKLLAAALVAGGLGLAAAGPAGAAEGEVVLKNYDWSHEGPFGTFDKASAQRGLQVFREVCAACHSVHYLAFRNLVDLGYTEDQAKAIASEYTINDGPNDEGEMFDRPATLSDRVPGPYPNEQAAAAANGGKAPPDLSLITKAREDGPNYVYSLLQGYVDPPEGIEVPENGYYNAYFPGHVIAMPPPLSDDQVTYADGTSATVQQMTADVVEFLTWVGEPKLEQRKAMGLKAVLFLVVAAALLFAYKRKVWADVAH